MAVPRKPAEYFEQVLPEYQGNPLIEVLPDILSSEEAMHLLRRRARYDEAERSLHAKYRIHCLGRLAHEYYQPLPQHFVIESKISVCIRQGYLNRNPAERGYVLMANELYAAMKDKRREYTVPGYHPNASGFTIIGVSGVGKSTAVESVLNLYPQVVEHREYKGKPLPMTQLVYLKIDCPHNGQLGGLCYGFFEEIDKVLGTDYYDQYKRSRITIDSMMILMKKIAHEYSLGLLVVDEVQHLAQAKSGSDAMLNFFVTLVNTIGVPVVLTIFSHAPGFVHFYRNQDKTSFCTELCFVHDHCPQPASFLRCFKTSKKMAAFYSHLQMGNVKTCSMSSFLSAPYKKGIHSQCIYPQVSLSRNALFCKPTKRFYYSWH